MSPPLISKAAARYTGAGGREHCSLCRHFSPRRGGRCARVLGDISPMGWCRLFSREMRGLVADASSFNGGGGGPSLSLDFMTPGVLDPLITFTRASTATYFDSAGVMQTAATNTPRWDYDPATLQLRGLLLEEGRQNLLLNSATLSTQSVTVTAQAYTLAFYGTGTITKSGTATGALVGTGVGQRVSQTFTPTAGTLTLTVTGTVSNAQIEAGAFATSYIPTTSAAVTRAIDRAFMTGTGFTSWFTNAAGTFAAEAIYVGFSPTVFARLIELSDGTSNNLLSWYPDVQTGGRYIVNSTIATVAGTNVIIAGMPLANVVNKVSISYGNARSMCLNQGGAGPSAVASAPGVIATVNRLDFGNRGAAPDRPGNMWLRRVSFWSRQFTDAELQAVTT